eukprot:4567934-Prymnesium_polylepis.1
MADVNDVRTHSAPSSTFASMFVAHGPHDVDRVSRPQTRGRRFADACTQACWRGVLAVRREQQREMGTRGVAREGQARVGPEMCCACGERDNPRPGARDRDDARRPGERETRARRDPPCRRGVCGPGFGLLFQRLSKTR